MSVTMISVFCCVLDSQLLVVCSGGCLDIQQDNKIKCIGNKMCKINLSFYYHVYVMCMNNVIIIINPKDVMLHVKL